MTMAALVPVIVMVAPTGARRSKSDHPRLPLSADEIAETADRCVAGGASLFHLHVRDRDGRHSLDPDLYRQAIAAIRGRVGDRLLIQITTESAGLFDRHQQMAAVEAVRPQAVSLALRELIPSAEAEPGAARFLSRLRRHRVLVQWILYDPAEISRLHDLRARGIIADPNLFPLFVLGRHGEGGTAVPGALLPFLVAWNSIGGPWAVCGFGPTESACALAAAAFGGHVRIGFENNLQLADGRIALDNADLVQNLVSALPLVGCRPATIEETIQILEG